MKHKIAIYLTLAIVLLLAACGKSSQGLQADATLPVSDANRVIYQMNVGAFTPEGTFQSAQARLDTLHKLGTDILWLMPIYPRGATMHSPYASMNFKAVNPNYGSVSDVKAFVARAHELGMKVWLDWVPNHVAVENPWVKTHPDYFNKDEQGHNISPNGWLDIYELNYQNPELVNEMNFGLKFWINECDVDGFRCDYVSSRTIPLSYWQNTISMLKGLKPGKTIEMMCEADLTNDYNARFRTSGFDYDYAWDNQGALVKLCREGFSTDSLKEICKQFVGKSQKVKNHRMAYLTNHDQNYNDGGHTLKDFYGDNRYGLTVLEFTYYGMPLIYNGQEIGDPDTLNYFTDAKVKWQKVDRKMQNTVRALVALHHKQADLAESAPVEFLETNNKDVLAWRRGKVVVVVNFANTDTDTKIAGVEAGKYECWLNSKTITNGLSLESVNFEASPTIGLEAKGYAVYVKQ